LVRASNKAVGSVRYAQVLSGPPKNHISITEKVVCGVILTVSVTAPMFYLLANVKNYRNRE
jgi:hypothetical protein